MNSFEDYLKEQGFKDNTIKQHRNYASYFLAYLAEVSLSLDQVTHTEILDFADQLRAEDRSINLINRMMLALRYYFSYLEDEGKVNSNPAIAISLRGSVRSLPANLLSKEELEQLYHAYQVTDERTHRNKVMLGLLIYQAVTREELEKLRPEHLKLREGRIQIPGTNRQNERILTLQPSQILDLQEYLLLIRPKLQNKSLRLFTGRNDLETLKNTLLHLNHALRRINPKVKSAQQIRQSVITEWLQEKELRTVQYMAGHRYVSSTERYQGSNMEELRDALNRFHPLASV
jgi:integrase/recombinase XerD